jgi:hypothetical protein
MITPLGLTLNSVPFPGLLATDEQREAYRQYRLALDNQPPPPPPAPIEPGPSLPDILNGLYQAGREAGRDEGREEGRDEGREAEREARRCKTTLQARRDAQRLQRLMDSCGLGLDDAGKELSRDLMQKGAHFKTAANRVSLAKNALKRDLVTG